MRCFWFILLCLWTCSFVSGVDAEVPSHLLPDVVDCVYIIPSLGQGKDFSRSITLHDSAQYLPEFPESEIEEPWDWHPRGRVTQSSVYASSGPGVSSASRSATSHSSSTSVGYQGNSSGGNAWHYGHGNYPKEANEQVVIGGDIPRDTSTSSLLSSNGPSIHMRGTRTSSSHSRSSSSEGYARSGYRSSSPSLSSTDIKLIVWGMVFIGGIIFILYLARFEILLSIGHYFVSPKICSYALQNATNLSLWDKFHDDLIEGNIDRIRLYLNCEQEIKTERSLLSDLYQTIGVISLPAFREIVRMLEKKFNFNFSKYHTIKLSARRNSIIWKHENEVTIEPLLLFVHKRKREDLEDFIIDNYSTEGISKLISDAYSEKDYARVKKLMNIFQNEREQKIENSHNLGKLLCDAIIYGEDDEFVVSMARLFKSKGGDASCRYNGCWASPLVIAILYNRKDVLGELLSYNEHIATESVWVCALSRLVGSKEEQETLFARVETVKDLSIFDSVPSIFWEQVMPQAKLLINKEDSLGNTPLGRAVGNWYYSPQSQKGRRYTRYIRGCEHFRVEALLRLGCNPNTRYVPPNPPAPRPPRTLMFYAAVMGNAPLIELLDLYGADVVEAYMNKEYISAVGIKPLLNKIYHRTYKKKH